ncbi:ArdC family protein [Arthrobacter psychrolactophilus]
MAPATSEHPDNKEDVGRRDAGPRPSSEDRLAGLTQQLQSLLEDAISTPGRWHVLLDTSATLWRYSGGNIALLMAQMEERGQQQPLLVAGFREWERHGRKVLKGEHALWSSHHGRQPKTRRRTRRPTLSQHPLLPIRPAAAARKPIIAELLGGGPKRSSTCPKPKASPFTFHAPWWKLDLRLWGCGHPW